MGYRDDHDAAIARIDALERERAKLEADNARLNKENAELARKLAAPKPPPEPRVRRPRVGAGVLFASVVVSLAGVWVILQSVRGCDITPGGYDIGTSGGTGAIISNGPTLGGTWRLELGRCASGQHTQFYGVDLVDKIDGTRILRIVEDPVRGTIVKMNVAGKNAARFIERNECSKWSVSFRPLDITVNGIRLLDGHVELDCKFGDGGTLVGRIDFTRCN